jgi:hypothetical protein
MGLLLALDEAAGFHEKLSRPLGVVYDGGEGGLEMAGVALLVLELRAQNPSIPPPTTHPDFATRRVPAGRRAAGELVE